MSQSTRNTVILAIVGLMVALTFLRWLEVGYEQVAAIATLVLAGLLGLWGLREAARRGPSSHRPHS